MLGQHANPDCVLLWMRKNDHYVWKMIQCNQKRLCEVSKCLIAHEQQRYPQQDPSWPANITQGQPSRQSHWPLAHSPLLLRRPDRALLRMTGLTLQSMLSNITKIYIFKTADPRWPGRAELLLWLFKSLRHPVIIASDMTAFLWKPHSHDLHGQHLWGERGGGRQGGGLRGCRGTGQGREPWDWSRGPKVWSKLRAPRNELRSGRKREDCPHLINRSQQQDPGTMCTKVDS